MRVLRIDQDSPFQQIVGVGGVGSGIFFALKGDHTLGRNESREGELLDIRDYCKLHIVLHYVAKLLGAHANGSVVHVLPIAMVGDDDAGRRLRQEMSEVGMDVSYIRTLSGKPSLFSVCFQYPDGEGGNITTNNSAAAKLSDTDIDQIVPALLTNSGKRTMAVAVPEVPLEVRRRFLQLASSAGAFRVASFVPGEIPEARKAGLFSLLDLVALNQMEAAKLVGVPLSADTPELFIEACLGFLRSESSELRMLVSAGKKGAYVFDREHHDYCPAPAVSVLSSAGAGDALLGGVLASLASGIALFSRRERAPNMIETALDFGVLLATYTCLSPHTINPLASLQTLIDFGHQVGLRFALEIERLCQGPIVPVNRYSATDNIFSDN